MSKIVEVIWQGATGKVLPGYGVMRNGASVLLDAATAAALINQGEAKPAKPKTIKSKGDK